jgi:hypothetical protein
LWIGLEHFLGFEMIAALPVLIKLPDTGPMRFRGRDINELVSNDARRKCDSSSDEAESVCHIGNPKGTVEFSWIEDL